MDNSEIIGLHGSLIWALAFLANESLIIMISSDATENLSLTQLLKMAFQNSSIRLHIISWKNQNVQTLQEMYRLYYLFINYE